MERIDFDKWRAYIKAVEAAPGDYTAQDRHLAELLSAWLDDRNRLLAQYLDEAAKVRELEYQLSEAQAQIAYYRSRP